MGGHPPQSGSCGEREKVSTEQLIAGLHQLAMRAHAARLAALVGTVLTWEDETSNGGSYSSDGEAVRQALNAWIRQNQARSTRSSTSKPRRKSRPPDPHAAQLGLWRPSAPSDDGYLRMGDSVDLAFL